MSAVEHAPCVAPYTATESRRINIIGKSNGVGLSRDIDVLTDALQRLGHEVHVIAIDAAAAGERRSVLAQWSTRVRRAWQARTGARRMPSADINLLLEHVWFQHLSNAKVNVALPNPEWFDRHDLRFLRHVDRVWAKTAYTRELFARIGCDVMYVGFDSEDRYDSTVQKQRTYFHLAGKSTMKGTDRLLRVWKRHPEWPVLTVVQNNAPDDPALNAPNIRYISGYLGDDALMRLQNENLFHICLSLTEGWGHYIVEALSVGAVTITIDAPPMNELVKPERGVLVSYSGVGKQRLATTYQFDERSLEAAIARTMAMSDEQCARLGASARNWFLQNKQSFASRLEVALRALSI
ncbi:MAG: glycosyl transferase family 1 [Gammaproteobacteria bacterium]|nr:glycosyl transferase family 1 [Gammaproteobacteria bacterium]